MAIDDRQINPVDQKTAELLLNRRLNLLQAPRTGGDLDLRTSILDAPRTGLRSLASEQMLQGQNLTGDLDPKLTANLPPEFAFLEKKPSRGRLTDSDFKGIDRASLRDQDLSRTDRRLREIAEEKGQPTQGMQVGPRRTNVAEQFVGGVEETDPMKDIIGEEQVKADAATSSTTKDSINALIDSMGKEPSAEEQKAAIDKYVDQFMSAMPEFEGKSKKEKGFDLARLGMAIAAGKDPNAINNIAKGFLAMGDTFTEDAKEKRLYNRQIALSAAKFGLENFQKDRNQEKADLRDLVYFVDANGNQVVKNKKQIMDDPESIRGLQTIDLYKANQEAIAKRTKNMATTMDIMKNGGLLNTEKQEKQLTKYRKAGQEILSANAGIGFFESAMQDLVDDKGAIVGGTGAATAFKNRIERFLGMSSGEKITQNEFISKLRQGFQKLIPLTLAESQSANSISNRDVEILAKALLGANILDSDGNFNFAEVDPKVLYNKLQGAVETFHQARERALNSMTEVEGTLRRSVIPAFDEEGQAAGGVLPGSVLLRDSLSLRPDTALGKAVAEARKEFKLPKRFEGAVDPREKDKKFLNFEDIYETKIDKDTGAFLGFNFIGGQK